VDGRASDPEYACRSSSPVLDGFLDAIIRHIVAGGFGAEIDMVAHRKALEHCWKSIFSSRRQMERAWHA